MKKIKSFGDVFEELFYTVNDFVKAATANSTKVYVNYDEDGVTVKCIFPESCADSTDVTAAVIKEILDEWGVFVNNTLRDDTTCTVVFVCGEREMKFVWNRDVNAFMTVIDDVPYVYDADSPEMLVEHRSVKCEDVPVDDLRAAGINRIEIDEDGFEDGIVRQCEDVECAEPCADEPECVKVCDGNIESLSYAQRIKKFYEDDRLASDVAMELVSYVIDAINSKNCSYMGDHIEVTFYDVKPDNELFFGRVFDGHIDFSGAAVAFKDTFGFSDVKFIDFPTPNATISLYF